ncbi:hypothetical protein DSM3645_04058, partial [Blastopirellula marina DSM 3645]
PRASVWVGDGGFRVENSANPGELRASGDAFTLAPPATRS